MRIEPKVVTPVAPDAREPKPATDKPTPAAVVKLSEAASTASKEVPSPSAARIAEIRAAVRRGAYPIDLDKLAAKIIDDEVVRGRG